MNAGAENGSNLRASANAWYPPAGRNQYVEPTIPVMNPNIPPPLNPNRPAEQLEEAAEMDNLLEEINVRRDMNMSNNTREMNNLLREINAGRAGNMPQRKNRKASRKNRKTSRKNRKASRKNRR